MRVHTYQNLKDFEKKDRARFNGLRAVVLGRDGHACIDCGMTQEQHIERWKKSLTINHIDGNGRKSKIPNNDLSNLETLCLRCHGKKDSQNIKWQIAVGLGRK